MKFDHVTYRPLRAETLRRTTHQATPSFSRLLAETALGSSPGIRSPAYATGQPYPAARTGAVSPPLVKIGTISSKTPTVSNLLSNNPAFENDCWTILNTDVNRGKDFTRLREGTAIFYNPTTRELVWGDKTRVLSEPLPRVPLAEPLPVPQLPHTENPPDAGATPSSGELGENLVHAVKGMLGRRYSDINCYEMVVNGLKKMGIQYGGEDGLGTRLIDKARSQGLPMNAFLTGEGLIQASGAKVYGKTLARVGDPEQEARKIMEEIIPHLENGGILSFSTESRGHTGVVSSHDGAWTFINSGVMDHSVGRGTTRKGVGEETLAKEIENWCKLAAGRRESLMVSLGRLDAAKLSSYVNTGKTTVS